MAMHPLIRAALDDAFARMQAGAHEAATSPTNRLKPPTEAQAKAGNYKLGTTSWAGLQIRIENPAFTTRTGVDENGRRWSSIMAAHYGYFAGTKGADGDGVDVFMGPMPETPIAWVINQNKRDGSFDEHKVMVGFADADSALRAYTNSYGKDWTQYDRKPVRATSKQLRWWLSIADKSRRVHPSSFPPERSVMDSTVCPDVGRVFWLPDGTPGAGVTVAQLLYRIRTLDGANDVLMCPMTMAEVLEGGTVETMDALVTEAGRLKPKMELLRKLMEQASGEVKPLAMQISDPVRRMGGVHVACIYEFSDGQTLTAWLHNPDSTPARLTPMDTLVSWKWLMNKRDVTLVVAPERGQDLSPREVARRVVRLIEGNSKAFQRANANRAAKMQAIQGLKDRLTDGQAKLADLNEQIATERPLAEARRARRAEEEADAVQAEEAWNSNMLKILRDSGINAIDFVNEHKTRLVEGRLASKTPQEVVDEILGTVRPVEIPENVRASMDVVLRREKDLEAGLARARETDAKFGGAGRYAAEVWRDADGDAIIARTTEGIAKALDSIPDEKNRAAAEAYFEANRARPALTEAEANYFAPVVPDPVEPEPVVDRQSLEEQRQMIIDMIATKKENREAIPEAWIKRLAELTAQLRGDVADDDSIYSLEVEGHPMFDGPPVLRNLIPIKVSSVADAQRKLDQALKLERAAATDFYAARHAVAIATSAARKKAAQARLAMLTNQGWDEDVLKTLRDITIAELSRLLDAAVAKWGGAVAADPAPTTPEPAPPAAPTDSPEVATLRAVIAGNHDSLDLPALYSKISQAVVAMIDSKAMTPDTEALANEAITHWAKLDQERNG
jgi:hypothetical protein